MLAKLGSCERIRSFTRLCSITNSIKWIVEWSRDDSIQQSTWTRTAGMTLTLTKERNQWYYSRHNSYRLLQWSTRNIFLSNLASLWFGVYCWKNLASLIFTLWSQPPMAILSPLNQASVVILSPLNQALLWSWVSVALVLWLDLSFVVILPFLPLFLMLNDHAPFLFYIKDVFPLTDSFWIALTTDWVKPETTQINFCITLSKYLNMSWLYIPVKCLPF